MKGINRLTIDEIAGLTGGSYEGDGQVSIEGANTLEAAVAGEISFLANPKYRKWLETTGASCVLVPDNTKFKSTAVLIKVKNPGLAFSKVLLGLYGEKEHPLNGVSDKISIDASVSLGENVSIGDYVKLEGGVKIGKGTLIYPGVYIGRDTVIGDECIIYPGVRIMDSVSIGAQVIIHAGSVIGSDGFGYATVNGEHVKVPQVGGVIIEDKVEIGANVTIDRGTPGDTFIGRGTKIDNLVQIAHNVRIGKNCFIVSQVGIAGSTVVGDNAVLAGQAGVVGHISIGAGAQVGAQAGVTRDVKPGQLVSGYPAMNHSQAKRINALIRKLPSLFKDLEKLKKSSRKD